MYEGKQIILDGELFGNNVVINRYFELIYNISPLIIKNFINIINETSFLSKPIRIKKYDFPHNNCINIHFKSKSSSGEIRLAYILNKKEELLIDTYTLVITEGKNQGYSISKQNAAAKNNPRITHKQYNICSTEEEFVDDISNYRNNSESAITPESSNNTADAENLEEILTVCTEESLNKDLKHNENLEEKNESQPLVLENNEDTEVENKADCNLLEEITSEINIDEIKKVIYYENINNRDKAKTNVASAELELEEKKEETVEVLSETKEKSEIPTEESIALVSNGQETITASCDVISETSIENLSATEETEFPNLETEDKDELINLGSTSNITSINNINICDNINSLNGTNLDISTELEFVEESKAEKEESLSDLEELFKKFEKIEFPENIDSSCKDSAQYDLVDFFDIIPKFTNDYYERKETLIVEYEEQALQNLNKEDSNNKKNRKNYKLNRKEKIALYQNILNGYDNKMIENKLNNFKEQFNTIQKENNITIEDVLDAQVELLIDNDSKAFRILGDNTKQDVIQIDDELFLSKDKIYTWGEAYLLDYSQDKA